MGKFRKIEVDDSMPCTKYEDFLLPKCENLDDLWPAILTKALIKLYSYKFNTINYYYNEVGDCSIIYSLTGYIGEKLKFSEDLLLDLCKMVLKDEVFFNKQKFLLCYNHNETTHTPDEDPFEKHEKEKRFSRTVDKKNTGNFKKSNTESSSVIRSSLRRNTSIIIYII